MLVKKLASGIESVVRYGAADDGFFRNTSGRYKCLPRDGRARLRAGPAVRPARTVCTFLPERSAVTNESGRVSSTDLHVPPNHSDVRVTIFDVPMRALDSLRTRHLASNPGHTEDPDDNNDQYLDRRSQCIATEIVYQNLI